MRHMIFALASGSAAGITGNAIAGDYVLEIEGKTVELDLNRPATLPLSAGKTATVVLRQKAEQIWRSDGVSFAHPSQHMPARRDIDTDIAQIMLTTPLGTSVLIQHYIGLDPHGVVDIVLGKMTEDAIGIGAMPTTAPVTRRLANGTTLSGKKVRTQHSAEWREREALVFGDHGGGYIFIATLSDISATADREMIARFWQTLDFSRSNP